MSDKIIQLIREMEFDKAYLLMYSLSLEDKWEVLSTDLYDEDPKIIYVFLLYLIATDGNEAEWQYYCCLYLIYCNPFFDDAMRLAAWHIKQAIRLNPKNIEYKKQVISVFYSYSEQYFSSEEYYQYAIDVLKVEQDNSHAEKISKSAIIRRKISDGGCEGCHW